MRKRGSGGGVCADASARGGPGSGGLWVHAYVQHKADQTGKTGQEAVQRGRSVVGARNGQRISMNRSRKKGHICTYRQHAAWESGGVGYMTWRGTGESSDGGGYEEKKAAGRKGKMGVQSEPKSESTAYVGQPRRVRAAPPPRRPRKPQSTAELSPVKPSPAADMVLKLDHAARS